MTKQRRTALVHDWLTGFRGGEQVLLSLARLFPEAPIYTLLHVKGSLPAELESRTIRTSFIGKLPFAARLYRHYLPLFPFAVRGLDVRGFDLVVSSSHCVAKSVTPGDDARHISYCHTPMRYVWDRFDDYFGPARVGRAGSAGLRIMAEGLRAWDVSTAHRVHQYVANSETVAARIRYFYGRDAIVIHPPVDTDFFTPGPDDGPPPDYDLVVSALVPYKRIDLAIDAARITGRRLLVVGNGPEEERLRARAGANVEFLGAANRDRLLGLYRGCRALLLPGVEDFGIVVAEALACGRPALVNAQGGGAEIVNDGEFGQTFTEPTAEAVARAMSQLQAKGFSRLELRKRAETFSRALFEQRFRAVVDEPQGPPPPHLA
ncbi:MAG: glycosyltransferase [Vicinamibacteria bacterium]|nr:glycosyltransferase [Vicinamibacteria bacterium]